MGPLDTLLERPWFGRRLALVVCKSGSVVGDPELKPVIGHGEIDVDALGTAMPDGIGNGFAKHLLQIELETDGDRALLAIGTDAAIDGPLLTETLGERAKLGNGIGDIELTIAPKREEEAPDLALLFHEQALQFIELGLNHRAGLGAALDGFHAEGGACQKLDNAVMDVASQ